MEKCFLGFNLKVPNAVNLNAKIHHNAKLVFIFSMVSCLSGFTMKHFSVGYLVTRVMFL